MRSRSEEPEELPLQAARSRSRWLGTRSSEMTPQAGGLTALARRGTAFRASHRDVRRLGPNAAASARVSAEGHGACPPALAGGPHNDLTTRSNASIVGGLVR